MEQSKIIDMLETYQIAILLNLLMIPHVTIMREENMIVEIFMLLNYLSLC